MNATFEIATIVETNPAAVLTDAKTYTEWYRYIKAETDAHVPDLSTLKGRDAIKSLAFKVTRSKTAIDAAGKKLNEDARAQINKVDEVRRKIKAELDTLADEVRKPLTEWESAEADRLAYVKEYFDWLESCAIVGQSDGVPEIAAKIKAVEAGRCDAAEFQGTFDQAVAAKARILAALSTSLARAEKAEADAIELERLRKQAAERAEAEAKKAALEHAERDRVARERDEEASRMRAAEEEKARLHKAAEDARLKAERDAEADRQKVAREHQAALDRAEAEKQAVIDAAARAERQREAEAKQAADDQAKRDADQKHRTEVKGRVKEALKGLGASEPTAVKIVLAIIAGEVPNVTLRF